MSKVSNDSPSVKRPLPRTLPVLDPLQDPRFFHEILDYLSSLARRKIPTKIGTLFSTLVCADESGRKNTRFIVGKGGDLLYQVFGSKTFTFTLPELRASIAAQRLVKFGSGEKPSHRIWKTRLLVEMQFLPRHDLPEVKTATVDWCDKRIQEIEREKKALLQPYYEGFIFLLQVRNYGNEVVAPAPYSHRFAAMWCGRDDRVKAGASISCLFHLKLLTSIARVKPSSGFEFDLLLTKEEADEYLLTHRPRLGVRTRRN